MPTTEDSNPCGDLAIGREAAIGVARSLAADPAVREWHAALATDGPVCIWDVWSSSFPGPAGQPVVYSARIDAGTGQPITDVMVVGVEPVSEDPRSLLYSRDPSPLVTREGMIEFIDSPTSVCADPAIDRSDLQEIARELGLSASLAPVRGLLDEARGRCSWMVTSLLSDTGGNRKYRLVVLDATTGEVCKDRVDVRAGTKHRVRLDDRFWP